MFKKNFLKFGAWVGVLPVLLIPASVSATVQGGGLTGAKTSLDYVGTASGQSAQGGPSGLPTIIGNMISVILSVLGIIFVVLIIQSGIQYMTSAGAEDKVKEAKKRMITAVIGIVIILAAYSISSFVISQITLVAAS